MTDRMTKERLTDEELVALIAKWEWSCPIPTEKEVGLACLRELQERRAAEPSGYSATEILASVLACVSKYSNVNCDPEFQRLAKAAALEEAPEPSAENGPVLDIRRYAQHLKDCAALASDGPFAPYPCSCGLDDLLDPVAAERSRAAHREAVALHQSPRGGRLDETNQFGELWSRDPERWFKRDTNR